MRLKLCTVHSFQKSKQIAFKFVIIQIAPNNKATNTKHEISHTNYYNTSSSNNNNQYCNRAIQ